jgi:hypothetical protein
MAEAVGMRCLEVNKEKELRGLSLVEVPVLVEVKVEVDDTPPTTKRLFPKS